MSGRVGYNNVVTDGLVLYLDAGNKASYPGSGTTWRDLSAYKNNGTLTNGPTFSSANSGNIVFDGTDDYVNVSHNSIFNVSEFSICFWFISKKDVDNYIVTKGNNSWYVGIGPSGQTSSKLSFFVEGTSGGWLQTNANITQNIWYFGTVTFKSNLSSIYLNNSLDNSGTRTGNPLNGTSDVTVGVRFDGTGGNLNGNLSNFLIYNRGLSASEVLQNYNAQKGRYGL
jgi:hypothetical protein